MNPTTGPALDDLRARFEALTMACILYGKLQSIKVRSRLDEASSYRYSESLSLLRRCLGRQCKSAEVY